MKYCGKFKEIGQEKYILTTRSFLILVQKYLLNVLIHK
jgi:hypothetical protein